MNRSSLLLEWFLELGPWLRRAFWHPLRQTIEIFHILPLLAALSVFGLLGFDRQLREIYLSALEDFKSHPDWSLVVAAAAAIGFALISAVLFEAHYLLSTMRINVVYSSNAKPYAGSKLRSLQRHAAIVLALLPWAGILVGLFQAKLYLVETFGPLVNQSSGLYPMEYLPSPDRWTVVGSLLVVGIAASLYAEPNSYNQATHRLAMALRPAIAAFFVLLLADRLPSSLHVPALPAALWGAGVAAVTVLYYFGYYWLHRRRFHFLYAHPLYADTGVYLHRREQILLFLWALVPWLLGALYLGLPHSLPEHSPPAFTIIPVAICAATAAGLVVALMLDRFREDRRLLGAVIAIVILLALFGLAASRFDAEHVIGIYRYIGPLATLSLGLLFLISTFVVLAWLSQRSGFPALTLVVAALIATAIFPVPIGITAIVLGAICAVFSLLAAVSRLGFVAAVAFLLAVPGAINAVKYFGTSKVGLHTVAVAEAQTLQHGFKCWLDSKGITAANSNSDRCIGPTAAPSKPAASADHRYPVFIVSAEGGGIYAASAAALFLAKLQDGNADFSQHVFAVSGVSGGAIGATIFQALEQSKIKQASAANPTQPAAPGCEFGSFGTGMPNPKLSLTDVVSAIMQADHFSPVVATIYPELLGLAYCTRPDALAASFEQSVNRLDGGAARILANPFEESWSEDSKVPALVLNSTWVETGFRAAFAPFGLHDIDDSLYSFDDKDMPIQNQVSLMNAAVVSARFPAILPPHAVSIDEKKDEPRSNKVGTMRWNFVDGGYADTSGAATALAIYQALKPIADARNVELRIILLTSSNPAPEPDRINGTAFGDTMAPMNAILNVREGLGNEAVARACNGVLKSTCNDSLTTNPCQLTRGSAEPDLQIVDIPDQTYKLPLGWKLSQTTFSVVRWMIGTLKTSNARAVPASLDDNSLPVPANQRPSEGAELRDSMIASRNSCVLNSILQTLDDWQQPAKRS